MLVVGVAMDVVELKRIFSEPVTVFSVPHPITPTLHYSITPIADSVSLQ
jgi:hypothetical protein